MEELDFPEIMPGMAVYDRSKNGKKVGILTKKGSLKDFEDYDNENILSLLLVEDPTSGDLDAILYSKEDKIVLGLYGECGYMYCLKEN